jgi:hypothetical protein
MLSEDDIEGEDMNKKETVPSMRKSHGGKFFPNRDAVLALYSYTFSTLCRGRSYSNYFSRPI